MTQAKRKRILVIEDEEALGRLLSWQLESAGVEVQAVTTGKAGMVAALENPPDLVILDLMLPDMHGYQICRELRKSHQPWTVPILMLTAMAKPIDQLRGFAHGADAYMTKPFDSAELIESVALLLGHAAAA